MIVYTEKDLDWVREQGLDPAQIAYDGVEYDAKKKVLRGYRFTGTRSVGGVRHKEAFAVSVETPPPWAIK